MRTVCTEPIIGQLFLLHQQNQKLRAARDLLLPRLVSGEVAVLRVFCMNRLSGHP